MPLTIGILACSGRHLDHLIGLARAARDAGHRLMIFFTGPGVRLTLDPRFPELDGLAEMALCRASLTANGLDPDAAIAGIPERGMTNQSWHGYMIDACDRYLTI